MRNNEFCLCYLSILSVDIPFIIIIKNNTLAILYGLHHAGLTECKKIEENNAVPRCGGMTSTRTCLCISLQGACVHAVYM